MVKHGIADEGYVSFRIFRGLLNGYIQRTYTTILSEIDKAPYHVIYHSRGNPRPPYGKSWESVLAWAVKVGSMTPHASVLKNSVQTHEMTRSTWPTVVPYFLKPIT